MSFRRYIAGTTREAMERVRRELGENAVILSNKRLGPGRIEIVAAGPESMEALVEQADRPTVAPPRQREAAREPARTREAQRAPAESFQEFIRRQAAPPAMAQREAAPARAAARAEPAVARGGVEMYHEVARVHAEAQAPAPARRPAPARPAAPALQPLVEMESPPAVFRRREPEIASAVTTRYAPEPMDGYDEDHDLDAARAAMAQVQAAAPALKAPAAKAPAAAAAAPRAPRVAPPAPPAEGEAMAMPAPAPRPRPTTMAAPETAMPPAVPAPLPATRAAVPAAAAVMPPPAAQAAAVVPVAAAPIAPIAPVAAAAPIAPLPAAPAADTQVMSELRALRAALSDRISALETNLASTMNVGGSGPAAQPPFERNAASTRVMTRLLMSGFSPEMARKVAQHAPATRDLEATDSWLHQVIAGNLRCATATESLTEIRGAVALVGPTGVGKTTTVAKLASRFAVRYGVGQLGLVTLDSYRIGAHDQLRGYSRILGVPMHVAQDGATLRELLASLQAKRLVLIDTCGLSQRDERMQEMMSVLRAARFNGAPLRPVLLLNAASNAETLDEVARAWNAPQAAGAVLTKLDEAARIGGAVDCLLRYRMMLYGLTNGQRVPEDWHQAGASLIAHVALKPSSSPFVLGDAEAQAWSEQPQGSLNA